MCAANQRVHRKPLATLQDEVQNFSRATLKAPKKRAKKPCDQLEGEWGGLKSKIEQVSEGEHPFEPGCEQCVVAAGSAQPRYGG